ncbi:ADYC domain-containing protein [Enhygromyxa salina]|uniref:ADYC domain-containing protein n=1 Tax=Enhygromyxa salina TaxID=215803 RepID=A0A2S9YPX7_9BACT|nr:ADYC domain-containing protein [Enhygromyxa salina]PRQ07154.1 hypothetical protein ENSA7_31690 [Enhygromyxa salina]
MTTHSVPSSPTSTVLSRVVMACALAVGLAPLAGCDEAAPDDDADLRGLSFDCPRWRCGYNTSEVNGKSLQELHLGGTANADGVRLVGFLPPQGLLLNWTLGTEGDALVARGGLFGKSRLRGAALVGSILLLRVDHLTVPVIIAGYEEVDSWATGGDPHPAYSLIYPDLAQPLLAQSVCKGTLLDPLLASVVVLAGERYDLDAKTVIPNQTDWITLACAGSAAAKMALMGYGPHADVDGEGTAASPDQRQATLKMLTADYCGDGHAYTVDGTPLIWENQHGTVVPSSGADLSAPEAIWTAAGALCLDTPRIPDLEVTCTLPSCATLSLDDGEWATYAVNTD